jgi:glycosyltransferase involved in cell wall biosynthesis
MIAGRQHQRWVEWVGQRPKPPHTACAGRVLLITYIFPPTAGSAVQRTAKLAKYLPACGWETEVLTAGHDRFPWRDESMLADVAANCRIHQIAGREPACVAKLAAGLVPGTKLAGRIADALHWRLSMMVQRVGIDDPNSLWVGPAARFAIKRHRRAPFDAIVSSGPPHFAHRVALRVARRTGVPWVADVRDPLVSDFDRSPAAARRIRSMTRLEQQILQHAAMVITTCPSLAEDFRQRYPQRRPDTICCVTNGFDRGDLAAALDVTGTSSDECIFVAAGAFYGRREIARIISPLQQVLDAHPQWQGRVRLMIAGTLDAEQQRKWQQDRPSWLTLVGYLDHASAVRLTAGADCAIIVVPRCRHGETSIPGKTFELLALPVHLLALSPPEGDTADIVRSAGASTIIAFEDEAGVATAIERIIASHFARRLNGNREWAALDRYDRALVAADFAACLTAVKARTTASEAAGALTSDIEPRPASAADNARLQANADGDSRSPGALCNVSI